MAEINTEGLTENDFLMEQLFIASKNARINSNRRRMWLVWTIVFFLFAKIFYDHYLEILAIYFMILGIFTALFFPHYTRWRYKRLYRQYIRDNYRNRFGEKGSVEIVEESIVSKTNVAEIKLPIHSLEEIFETAEYYFIKTNTAIWIFIKKTKGGEQVEVQSLIDRLVQTNKIKHSVELDWEWK